MHKLCLLFVFALLSNEALGFRIKRQSEDSEEDVEDRYGWNRPGRFPNQGQSSSWSYPSPMYPGNFPWQYPGQNQRPGQFPGQQFPGQQFPGQQFPGQQFPGQGGQQFPGQQFPGQGGQQFPGQGGQQFPGQGGQQFPGQQFPGQGGQGQNPGQVPNPNQPTTQPPSGSTTQSAAVQDCIRQCLVTPEYNPVCGTDNRTYDNPGRLLCAQSCGVNVTQVRASRCPNVPIPPVA